MICVRQVAAEADEIVDDGTTVVLQRVVKRRLAVLVAVIVSAAMLHKKLTHLKVAHTDRIVDRILPVSVNMAGHKALINEELGDFQLAVARCIVQRSLLEVVFVARIDALLDELGHQLNDAFFVTDRAGREQKILVEVVGVDDFSRRNIMLLEHLIILGAVTSLERINYTLGDTRSTGHVWRSNLHALVRLNSSNRLNDSEYLLRVFLRRHRLLDGWRLADSFGALREICVRVLSLVVLSLLHRLVEQRLLLVGGLHGHVDGVRHGSCCLATGLNIDDGRRHLLGGLFGRRDERYFTARFIWLLLREICHY